MHHNPSAPDYTVGILGTGLMGQGIAQIASQAGLSVILLDAAPGAAEKAKAQVGSVLNMLAGKGKITQEAARQAVERISVADSMAGFADCHLVIEAIVEKLDVKCAVFRQLEEHVSDDCLLASNTSSLSITEIAVACKRPERVAGFHFFSPVPLMKVVEVIAALQSAPWTGDVLAELAKRMGHAPVRTNDSPGFVINNAGRGYPTEGLRLLEESVAAPEVIDAILKQAAGFRMGPFELLDLTGLDVSQPAMEAVYNQFFQEPRFRPSVLGRQRLAANILGRKTGQGFYRYQDGKKVEPPLQSAPFTGVSPVGTRVWLGQGPEEEKKLVRSLLAAAGAVPDTGPAPRPEALCLVFPLGRDATSAALAEGLDPRRTLALDVFCGLSTHRTLMTTPLTGKRWSELAQALFSADGVPASVIHDSAGFVTQRVIACIVNLGCEIAQRRIASPEDIDRAVTLGLGYPKGPLALGDHYGPRKILAILQELQAAYGDPRYRPSPWLTRRARLEVSLLTPEA